MKIRTQGDAAKPVARLSKRELFARYQDIVLSVIGKYREIKSLHPLVASSIDPSTTKPSQRLSFELIAYGADIEKATEQALGSDRLDLQSTWFSLALNQPVKTALRNEVIERCGRLYSARKLAPWEYWQRGGR